MKAKKKSKKKYLLYIEGGMIQSKPTDPPKDKSGYSAMMEHLIDVKGGTEAEYKDLMNRIAYHETGANQRMRADAIQETKDSKGVVHRDGVGRGLFQLEAGIGAGGITAVNRTYREFQQSDMEIPQWLEDAYRQKSLDASTLNKEQQEVLFIGNYLQHPKANLGDWQKGKVSTEEFWGKFHHAGGDSTNYKRFQESMKSYDDKYNK